MNSIKTISAFVAIMALSTTSAQADQAMNATFSSMKSCLAGIQRSSGQKLKIVTDKPNEVSGFLENGKGFGCQKKESGTEGVHYAGWYLVKD